MPAKTRSGSATAVVVQPEQVDTWRLAQQHLLELASSRRLLGVVTDVIAVHAQMASAAELQLRARVSGITAERVQAAVAERRLVKTWAMRGTLHLIAADDLPLAVAALSGRDRWRKTFWLRYFKVTLGEMEALYAAIPEALDGRELTREELADEMGRRVSPRMAEHLRSGWGRARPPISATQSPPTGSQHSERRDRPVALDSCSAGRGSALEERRELDYQSRGTEWQVLTPTSGARHDAGAPTWDHRPDAQCFRGAPGRSWMTIPRIPDRYWHVRTVWSASRKQHGRRRQMMSMELIKVIHADRERQLAGRHRPHSTEDQGRRVRINRRAAGR